MSANFILRSCQNSPGSSYNNKSGVGSRLVITVYVREFLPDSGLEEDENHLTLAGTMSWATTGSWYSSIQQTRFFIKNTLSV